MFRLELRGGQMLDAVSQVFQSILQCEIHVQVPNVEKINITVLEHVEQIRIGVRKIKRLAAFCTRDLGIASDDDILLVQFAKKTLDNPRILPSQKVLKGGIHQEMKG